MQWLNKKYTYKLYICIPTICLEKHIFISVIIVRIELDTFWRSFGQNGECRNQPKWEYSGNALPKIVVVKNKVFGYKTNHDMMISGHHGDIIDNIWDFTEEPNNNSSFWLRIPSKCGIYPP